MKKGYHGLVKVIYLLSVLIGIILVILCPNKVISQGITIKVGEIQWLRKPLKAGDIGVVKIGVVYLGEKQVLGASIKLMPRTEYVKVISEEKRVSLWRPGEIKFFDFTLEVLKIPLEFEAKVIVEWEKEAETGVRGLEIISVKRHLEEFVIFNVIPEALVEINIKPSRLILNNINKINIIIHNNSSDHLRSLRIILLPQGLTFLDTPVPFTIFIERMGPREKRNYSLLVVPTNPMPVTSFKVSYITSDGSLVTRDFSKSLYACTSGIIKAVFNPSTVIAGAEQEIFLEVVNNGDLEIKEAVLTIIPSPGSQILINNYLIKIGDIKPLEVIRKPLRVIVPLTTVSSQVFNYEITYRTTNDIVEVTKGALSLNILAFPEVKVSSIDMVPSTPLLNTTLTISVGLFNTGSTSANNLNVSIVTPPDIEVIRRSYVFLGTLAPQSPVSVAFSIIPHSTGSHNITVNITYTDLYGGQHVKSRVIKLNVFPQE